jgi:hypothetical protein
MHMVVSFYLLKASILLVYVNRVQRANITLGRTKVVLSEQSGAASNKPTRHNLPCTGVALSIARHLIFYMFSFDRKILSSSFSK